MADITQYDTENSDPKVIIIEPFYGGSHKQLVDVLTKRLHSCTLITMKAKKWHWRARCSPLSLYGTIPIVTTEKVLFCSSVLNVAELLGVRPDLHRLKKIVYFHENQFVYPVREIKSRDVQYCYNEVMTCLAADVILFNSHYNMNSLLEGIPKIIKLLPDYRPKDIIETIKPKCQVLYFPIEYQICQTNQQLEPPLHVLWPHRWEFDKNPDEFFDILKSLKHNGLKFHLSVLGEAFSEVPLVFETAKEALREEIKHFGYVDSKDDYYNIIRSCHVVVSTARHEFFGVALLEAAYCGCYVLAPNRLVYPEIYPKTCLYDSQEDLYERLAKLCSEPASIVDCKQKVNIDFDKYSSETLLPVYLKLFETAERE